MSSPKVQGKKRFSGKVPADEVPNGQPLGIYDTNSVRARIDKWQTINNGESQSKGGDSQAKIPSPTKFASIPKPEPFNTQNHAPKQRDTLTDKDAELKAKEAGRPRRRLVSDEHWKSGDKAHHVQTGKGKNKVLQPSQGKPNAWVRPRQGQPGASKPAKDKSPDKGTKSPKKENVEPSRAQNLVSSKVSDPSSDPVGNNTADEDADAALDVLGGTLNARNLRLMASGRPLGADDAAEKPKPYYPALQYFAGRAIPDPPAEQQAQQAESPPKKPTDFRPALQYLAGKPVFRPSKAPENAQGAGKKAAVPDPHASAKVPSSGHTPPTLGRIEAWLGDASDPFVHHHDKAIRRNALPPGSPKRDYLDRSRETELDEERRKRKERRRAHHPNKVPDESADNGIDGREEPVAQENFNDHSYEPKLSQATLKRSGARRRFPSPQKPTDVDRQDRSKTWSPTPQARSDLSSIVPDDSASMLFVRQQREMQQPRPQLHNLFTKPATGEHSPNTPRQDSTVYGSGRSKLAYENIASVDFQDASGPMTGPKRSSTKRRKLTSHADLMSVLSNDVPEKEALASACGLRSTKSRNGERNLMELMEQLKLDEQKYMRDLQTLIGGVIPVLLTKALSASQQKLQIAGSNSASPIVGIGTVLERLRSIHKRLPLENCDALLFWAPQAHKVYSDYISVWRLGFENVSINLSIAADETQSPLLVKDAGHEETGSPGCQTAEVAHLLKRPLVRVKNLAKTLKGISSIKKSALATDWASRFHDLVEDARRRQTEEKARLEDEAAASIDASRARDPRTLAPLSGVHIDPQKVVKARDLFSLRLHHSSGQRIDCQAEIIVREDVDKRLPGDVLICELNTMSRWLLLPPTKLDRVSARFGDGPGEAVVLLRSGEYSRAPWQEIISIHAPDIQTASDWIELLGRNPTPPEIPPEPTSFTEPSQALTIAPAPDFAPSPTQEVDIPFGERSSALSRRWESPTNSPAHSAIGWKPKGSENQLTPGPQTPNLPIPRSNAPQSSFSQRLRQQAGPHRPSRDDSSLPPQPLHESVSSTSSSRPESPMSMKPGLKNTPDRGVWSPAGGQSRGFEDRPSDYHRMRRFANRETLSEIDSKIGPASTTSSVASTKPCKGRPYSVWIPPATDIEEAKYDGSDPRTPVRVGQGSTSFSEPVKQTSRVSTHHSAWAPSRAPAAQVPDQIRGNPSASALSKRASGGSPTPAITGTNDAKPLHSSPTSGYTPNARQALTKVSSVPSKTRPASQPSTPQSSSVFKRPISSIFSARPSSPLKNEYDPRTGSDDDVVDTQAPLDDDDDAQSISSASSAEDLVPSLPAGHMFSQGRKAPKSVYVPKNPETLAPSQSASQGAYRGVSANAAGPADSKIARIFCWSEKGAWEELHAFDCSIVVSPGLIEAYEMSAAHSSSQGQQQSPGEASPYFSSRPQGVAPLVGLELTPLVPLRRGTAIDISIRSPLTKESQLKAASNQIMFRSRNNLDCDRLYGAINQARINNPTYIALENARPPQSNWGAIMDARPEARPAWWKVGKRRSSYRAGSSRRTPSIAAQTHDSTDSAATMSSALSMLRRFSAGSKMFSVARSTITHGKAISLGDSSATHSSSSGEGTLSDRTGSGSSTPPAGVGIGLDPSAGAPLGIKAAKIRLYTKVTAGNKWREIGPARLTIMHPPRPLGAPPALASDGRLVQEKRIFIQEAKKDTVIMDVTLDETMFERAAVRGIAMQIWERMDGVDKRGSVMEVRKKVFMLQMRSEAEAAYTFSLVGRMRY